MLVLATLVQGCGGAYEATALKSWDLMARGQTERALKLYEENVTRKEDQLLRLMDEGILLRVAGDFSASNAKFFEAAELLERNGYLSISEQGVSLMTNEQTATYQGEDFEKVLIHLYLGLNFLALGEPESALVETRRVNEILHRMIHEGKRPYELNPFARYLGGMLFENDREPNDAYIAYKNVLKISPELKERFEPLGKDLIRTAKLMGFDEDLEKLRDSWGKSLAKKASQSLANKEGSVVLLLESGKSPVKRSTRERHYSKGADGNLVEIAIPLPVYERRYSAIKKARLIVEGHEGEAAVSDTLYDIEVSAMQFLKDRSGRIVAKALVSAGLKIGAAVAIGKATKNEDLGLLAGLALIALSQADTRSWLLLPGKLQVAKIYLPAGTYNLRIEYLNFNDTVLKTENVPSVHVLPLKSTFLQRRVYE